MNKGYRLLPLLAMVYVTIKLLAILLFYKVIYVFGIMGAASALIIPLWFCIGDVITEVYGYKYARQLVYVAAFCQLVFGCIAGVFNNFTASKIGIDYAAYAEVLGHLPQGALASCLAIIFGGVVNAFILNKWKLALKGKFFILRSLGSTSIGEFVFTVCVYALGFYKIASFSGIFELIMTSYLIKLAFNPIMVLPVAVIKNWVKAYEAKFINVNNIDHANNNKTKMVRIKSNMVGDSYFCDESHKLELTLNQYLGVHAASANVREMGIKHFKANTSIGWHISPDKQYIILLNGVVEFTSSVGESIVLNTGNILFATDTSGKGHTTKFVTDSSLAIIKL